MRVLQVCQPADGGVANHVLSLSSALRERGWSVDVACSTGALADELRRREITVYILPLVREVSPPKDLAATLHLREIVSRGGYSLVHTHSAKAGVVGRVAARIAGTPALYTPHAWSFLVSKASLERRLYSAVEQALARVSDRIICVSAGELELGQATLRGSEKKLRLVPNGVEVPTRTRRRPADGKLVVGTIARLARQKGISYLIHAAEKVCAACDDVRFLVAGGGPDLYALQDEITARGLDERFRLVGPVDEPWEFLGQLDVFVMPSLWEGMPYVLLEAMGFGLPVVATDVGGVRDVITGEGSDMVVPPADPPALAEAILRYLDSPHLRETTGDAARWRIRSEFSQQQMIDRTLDVYSEVLR